MNLSQELDIAILLSKQAGKLALEINQKDFSVTQKPEFGGPVTEADLKANELITSELAKHFPDDQIIGEESDQDHVKNFSSNKRTWWVDPIDGTKEFVKKSDEWSVIIGLCFDNKPILGVIYQPTKDILYYGSCGNGAFKKESGQTTKLSICESKPIDQSTIILSKNHPHTKTKSIMSALGITQSYTHGSVGLKIAQIAEQKADLYVNFAGKCHFWDTCGPELLLTEAGGVLLKADQTPILYDSKNSQISETFFASNHSLQNHLKNIDFNQI